jgi:hypothetical protein
MHSWACRSDVRWIALLVLCCTATAARADGPLGIYFDSNGQSCSGDIGPGSYTTLYVLLQPTGSLYSGAKGGEFRVDTGGATGYLVSNPTPAASDEYVLGNALGGGATAAFTNCQTGAVIAFLSFQVLNMGNGAEDGTLRIVAKQNPSNPAFACPLAVQCDDPVFTKVCVDGGLALINPSGSRSCSGGRLPAEWSRVKGLYRP